MHKRNVVGVSPLSKAHHNEKPPLLGGIQLQSSIDIRRAPKVCYAYWRDFTHLPRFMTHLQTVEVLDDRKSHWIVDGPADTTVEWDAELLEDVPNERISWRSLENAQIDNAGSVEFVPLDKGRATRVKVALTYNPVLGRVGDLISHLFGETPDQDLTDDLSRLKQAIERGE